MKELMEESYTQLMKTGIQLFKMHKPDKIKNKTPSYFVGKCRTPVERELLKEKKKKLRKKKKHQKANYQEMIIKLKTIMEGKRK